MSVEGEKGMVAMRWAVAKIIVLETKVNGQVTVNSSFFFYIYLLSPYSIKATWHCVVLGDIPSRLLNMIQVDHEASYKSKILLVVDYILELPSHQLLESR
jgi:hypothetical protein